MSMTSMNISLPQELKEYIERQIKFGYSTPSEYVRELIRGDQKRRAKERLDVLLLEGLDSGKPLPAPKGVPRPQAPENKRPYRIRAAHWRNRIKSRRCSQTKRQKSAQPILSAGTPQYVSMRQRK